MAETQAQKRARLAKRRKEGVGKIFNDMFTTRSQARSSAAENKGFKNLQGTINKASAIAASKGKPKQGPQRQQGGYSFSDEVAASNAANASVPSKPRKKSKSTKAKITTIETPKTKKTESKKLVESNAVKEARKKMQDAVSKPLSGIIGGDPEANVSNTKKERRQLLRARRRAARKSTDGTYTADQLREERDKITSRSAARKQYLRNFASQLARGEQAAPTRSFGEGGPSIGVDLAKKAEQDQQSSDAAAIKSSVEIPTEKNKGLGLDSFTSLSNIGNNQDSNPSSYLNKEYLSKRFGKMNF